MNPPMSGCDKPGLRRQMVLGPSRHVRAGECGLFGVAWENLKEEFRMRQTRIADWTNRSSRVTRSEEARRLPKDDGHWAWSVRPSHPFHMEPDRDRGSLQKENGPGPSPRTSDGSM